MKREFYERYESNFKSDNYRIGHDLQVIELAYTMLVLGSFEDACNVAISYIGCSGMYIDIYYTHTHIYI